MFQWLSVYASATKKSSNKRRVSTPGTRVPHGERKIPLISQCYSPKGAVLTNKKKGNYFHGSTQELQYVVSYLKMETKETILNILIIK